MTEITAKMVLAACDAYRKSCGRKPVNGSYVEDMRKALEAALGAQTASPESGHLHRPDAPNPSPPEPSAGWRGIESAPRDGTEIEIAAISRVRWIPHPVGYEILGPMWESATTCFSVDSEDFNYWRPVGELEEHKALSPLVGQGEEGSSRAMKGGSPPLRAAKSDSGAGH